MWVEKKLKNETGADDLDEARTFSVKYFVQLIVLILWSAASLSSPAVTANALRDCNSTSCISRAVRTNLGYRFTVPLFTITLSFILILTWKSRYYIFSFKSARVCIAVWSLSISLLLVETIVSISYGSDTVSQYLNFRFSCENSSLISEFTLARKTQCLNTDDLDEKQEYCRPVVFQFCLVSLSVVGTLLLEEVRKRKVQPGWACSIVFIIFAGLSLLFFAISVFQKPICHLHIIILEFTMSIIGITALSAYCISFLVERRERCDNKSWIITNKIQFLVFGATFTLGIIPVAVFSFVTNKACRGLETCYKDRSKELDWELAGTCLYLFEAFLQVVILCLLKRSNNNYLLVFAGIVSSLNFVWCVMDITYWARDESQLARYLEHKENELYTNWLFILRTSISIAAYFRYKCFVVFLVSMLEKPEETHIGRTQHGRTQAGNVQESDSLSLLKTVYGAGDETQPTGRSGAGTTEIEMVYVDQQ